MTLFILACMLGSMLATLGCLLRMVLGPTTLDRVLAFDGIVICSVALLVLFSIYWQTVLFVELIVVIASLGFLTTVAFYFYLSRQAVLAHGGDRRAEAGVVPSAGARKGGGR
jgi:multicomponent K+:H+ antiporter subunit F